MQSIVKTALRDAMPIMLAYFPIAMTFGVIATSHGISWLITMLISAWVYAGGAQFMLVSLALTGASATSTILTVLLVNSRHLLYGTTLGPAFKQWPEWKKWLSAFGLSDEVFAVTSSRVLHQVPSPSYQIIFGFVCYAAWVSGTAAGLGLGTVVPTPLASVFGFALPAMFMALLLMGKRSFPYFIAAFCGALCAILANFVDAGSLGIIVGSVVGATVGMFVQRLFKTSPVPAVCD